MHSQTNYRDINHATEVTGLYRFIQAGLIVY